MTSTTPPPPPWTTALARLGSRRSLRVSLALIDQAAVSGVSFATSILIGRWCGKPELGVYALGMSILFLAIAAQQSLISAAHTVFSVHLEEPARARYNGAVAVQMAGLCLLIVLALGAAALWLSLWREADTAAAAALLALVIACPCILLREFVRRFEFARFNLWGALRLDMEIAGLQLLLLFGLALSSMLSGATGLVAIGAAGGLSAGVWCFRNRGQFRIVREDLAGEFARGWSFGRWVFAGQVTFTAIGSVIQWIAAAMIGEASVGVYSACMMLVLLANPVVLGLQNLLSPGIARALRDGGPAGVRRVVAESTLALTLLMSAYLAVIVWAGDWIVTRLYGQAFAGNGLTMGLLGIGALATAVGVSANHGLRTIERPELNFAASLFGLTVAVVSVWLLIPTWGVAGAALAFALSCSLTACLRIASFILAVGN